MRLMTQHHAILMKRPRIHSSAVLLFWALIELSIPSHPAAAAPPETGFATPLPAASLDAAAFAAWVDGAETVIQPRDAKDREHSPQWVIWTRTTQPGHSGLSFGDSKRPGVRHLRIGFTTAIPVGSVLVKCGGQLSVLKADAAYPGDLGNDSAWQPAQRLKDGQVTGDEVVRRGEFAIWVLPPGTTTRALRFTHTAAPVDKEYAGWLGGAFVLAERVANIAPQALASASSRNEAAGLLNNSTDDNTWKAWDNGKEGAEQVVSPEHPEWITLVWPRAVSVRALNVLWAGFGAVDVQVYTGPATRHPREAADGDWQTVGTFDKIEHQYPRTLGVNWLDFGHVVTTRAVRLRITQAPRRAEGHLQGRTHEGKRVWLGELLALQTLGNADLNTAILSAAPEPTGPPPIPVRFTLKEAGFVTLVIEKPDGLRVRNLVSETPFPAGEHVVPWDGTDDWLRDKDAAAHGIFHIPARFVEPGRYRVRGLVRQAHRSSL